MTAKLTDQNVYRIAVVGAGPSGFFAAENLLNTEHSIVVDMFERLSAPFGLVRYGVAPDHPKLKTAICFFDKTAHRSNFNFFGNVEVGKDVPLDLLLESYHAVILAHGAGAGRNLGVPGEQLKNCHTAASFVGWYNGHPDFASRKFDLSARTAAIIGHGNGALDIARILMKPIKSLRGTDIAGYALDALARSQIEEVHIIGRRGPGQVKFTSMELRELGELPDVDVVVSEDDLVINKATQTELADKKNFLAAKNVEIFRAFMERDRTEGHRKIVFRFCQSPEEILGDEKIKQLRTRINHLDGEPFHQNAQETGETSTLECGLLFSSIGYMGEPLAGLPFDFAAGAYTNSKRDIVAVPGLFAVGWIKRGPTGIIGTNKACAKETVQTMLRYLSSECRCESKSGFDAVGPSIKNPVVSYKAWKRMDSLEIEAGARRGKIREKITDFANLVGTA